MFRKPLSFLSVLILTVVIIIPSGGANAQCFGSLMLSPGFFEFDYLVRLAVHFGTAEDIPTDIICSRGRMPGEQVIEVPVWVYNVHEGITYLEYAVESNDSIIGFDTESCFTVTHESIVRNKEGSFNHSMKIETCVALCGPTLVGRALIVPGEGSELTWINLVRNRHSDRMYSSDKLFNRHDMFSPNHGGYVGTGFLYTCQDPICPEPNIGVTDLIAESSFGYSVKLTWTAGEGNVTVIRAGFHGYPAGYADGRLVVEMPTIPGQQYFF